MRIGGPVFVNSADPVEIVQAHKDSGYRAAVVSNELSLNEPEKVKAYREEMLKNDIVIAEVGAWSNMLAAEETSQGNNLDYICERLALADELGAKCCVNILGTYSKENWYGPHPDNFSQHFFAEVVEKARYIIDTVKPSRTKLSFEMMPFNLLDTPENYLRLIKAIDRPEVGVHLDPVNLINSPRAYYNNGQIIADCFIYLGPYILSCHAKDIWLDPEPFSTVLEEVRPGKGNLDYQTYLRNIEKISKDLPLIIEHLPDKAEYQLAYNYITEIAEREGISY